MVATDGGPGGEDSMVDGDPVEVLVGGREGDTAGEPCGGVREGIDRVTDGGPDGEDSMVDGDPVEVLVGGREGDTAREPCGGVRGDTEVDGDPVGDANGDFDGALVEAPDTETVGATV